ncbi:MAG: S9 family peptidase [Cytophagales bacterium]|jgi:oligopeptidase B|nr:S9 family peptidase [Cytophagales bacterium]MCA6388575.1 S9 family peptidase [Cytophagales bacterium]MCA6393222.1 S9 family peptidase [Cytophagales bacterium]MCA6395901.1 S9 family peptidase [Cytophagales bacterium]MCA6397416.1 S9 family peptidase [Cytophagales bacterium]
MKAIKLIGLVWVAFALVQCQKKAEQSESAVKPPVADKEAKELTGNRIDNYYWMKLSDEQKNATQKDEQTQKVVNYLTAENDYLKTNLKHTEGLQKKVYDEIIGRIKQTDESVPYKDNGYWYYTRFEQGAEYPIYCRKKGTLQGIEEILLNVNDMAKGHSYYSITGLSVSEDNNLLAYAEDSVSRRRYTVYVKDLRTGKLVEEPVPNTEGQVTWANDNKTYFYTKKDSATLRSRWIIKHKVGTTYKSDPVVSEEKDETFYTGIYKTKSNKFLVIWAGSTLTNHYQILDANTPDGKFKEFNPRERGLEYSIDHYGDKFYVVTNLEARNFRLMETPDTKTAKANWKEKIAHRKDTLLQSIEIFKNHLVLSERAQANTLMRIINQKTNETHYLNFGEPAYTIYPSINLDFDTELLRYGYTSMTTPNSTYDYNMNTKQRTLLKQQEVVGGYKSEEYQTERIWAEATDGTKIPMSIVYKKGLQKNGNNPTMLYGYGSYGASMDPTFSITRLSLLNRGFVYAIAHIRGGQEMGRQWYEDGKLFKKKNTFTDFINCAEFLIEEKYTQPEKLFATGGSAGGLLMGAVVNMRPDLFKGVIAAVPFVDVITTMQDESIPLTTGEFDEWGNPKDPESYMYMLEYSPYDQVKPQNYPNMLVTTGFHDSQVQYWEPAKWVAKLRAMKTDNNKLLLRTNMETGHGGTTGRFKRYEEISQEYAFVLDLAGIKE